MGNKKKKKVSKEQWEQKVIKKLSRDEFDKFDMRERVVEKKPNKQRYGGKLNLLNLDEYFDDEEGDDDWYFYDN